jgi:hypothetical protein
VEILKVSAPLKPRPRGHGSVQTRKRISATSTGTRVRADALPRPRTVKTRPQDKRGCGRTSGRRPDGLFYPKTSIMTTLGGSPDFFTEFRNEMLRAIDEKVRVLEVDVGKREQELK